MESGAWEHNCATGGHKYREVVLQVGGLDARLIPRSVRKITVVKYNELKTGWSNSRHTTYITEETNCQNLLSLKNGCSANVDDHRLLKRLLKVGTSLTA
jgi:hypothetical protein